ncbi:hypothetical protein PRIPAC_76074, partial [Pristionchus pacificus]|uniref:Uncharacterized protein n=1 Tax=Pristionchus pacificus TaxID=54126 RepID=A0A2A6BFH1_PRIPA
CSGETRQLIAYHVLKNISIVVSNGITYEVSDDASTIKVILPNGDSSMKCATFQDPKYTNFRGLSNGIMWNGEAYFACRGFLWILNLDRFEWRDVSTRYHRGAPIWEKSTANDLLLLTNEESGTILFTRFRPSFDDCKFVINYGYRLPTPGQSFNGIMPFRDLYIEKGICMPTRQDGIFTMPREWWKMLSEKGMSECEIPEEIRRVIIEIYDGIHTYPRSHIETLQLWKPSTMKSQSEQETINQLRARSESKCVYSRECPVCYVPNPELRAVLIECGHLICLACTMQQRKIVKKTRHVWMMRE